MVVVAVEEEETVVGVVVVEEEETVVVVVVVEEEETVVVVAAVAARHLHPLHADGRRLLQEADDVDVAREAGDSLGGDAVARDGGGVGAVGEQELGDAL